VIHFCGLKLYRVPKCVEWCQCSMETVSCRNGLSVNGPRGSKMVAQALSMGKEPDSSPHPLLMQTWKESMAWSCRTDRCPVLTGMGWRRHTYTDFTWVRKRHVDAAMNTNP
jgi:hypothetical protein